MWLLNPIFSERPLSDRLHGVMKASETAASQEVMSELWTRYVSLYIQSM